MGVSSDLLTPYLYSPLPHTASSWRSAHTSRLESPGGGKGRGKGRVVKELICYVGGQLEVLVIVNSLHYCRQYITCITWYIFYIWLSIVYNGLCFQSEIAKCQALKALLKEICDFSNGYNSSGDQVKLGIPPPPNTYIHP